MTSATYLYYIFVLSYLKSDTTILKFYDKRKKNRRKKRKKRKNEIHFNEKSIFQNNMYLITPRP